MLSTFQAELLQQIEKISRIRYFTVCQPRSKIIRTHFYLPNRARWSYLLVKHPTTKDRYQRYQASRLANLTNKGDRIANQSSRDLYVAKNVRLVIKNNVYGNEEQIEFSRL